MRVSRRSTRIAGVDLSPMLDVIFQLILFFLVSTTFAALPGISVNLPESSTAQSTDASGITITIEDTGRIFLDEKETSMKELDGLLSLVETGSIEKDKYPVSIAADSKVTNGTLVEVFDSLRRNGFSAVSLRTTNK